MRSGKRSIAHLALALCLAAAGPAFAQDPKVAIGVDPGLEPIALFTTGIDYTDAAIAPRLARDGEGELIAWDFVDNDRRPFAKLPNETPPNWGGDGTAVVRKLIAGSTGKSVIVVRINPADPASLARALVFVSQTRAKSVAVPMWSALLGEWEPFQKAAAYFSGLEIVVTQCEAATPGHPMYPAAFDLPNLRKVMPANVTPGSLEDAIVEPCRQANAVTASKPQ